MSKSSPEFYPICPRRDCFGNDGIKCIVLASSDFKGECPFFKTREQIGREHEHTKARIYGTGKEQKYKHNIESHSDNMSDSFARSVASFIDDLDERIARIEDMLMQLKEEIK